MNDTLINKYFKGYTKNFTIRKTLFNAISFFLEATLRAKSFVPAKVGSQVKKIKPYNGIKRVQRLLKNKFFSNEFCLNAYQHFMKILIPKDEPLTLALDWTIIKDKYCFLSISWVLKSGRSIPLYFDGRYATLHCSPCNQDGYEKKKLNYGFSQSSIEKKSLNNVFKALSHVKDITVLADRGFDSPAILQLIIDHNAKFVVRAKIDKWLTLEDGSRVKISHDLVKKGSREKLLKVKYTEENPVFLNFYALWLKKQDEPWLLLSNIDSSVKQIADSYATRWEIEEMFKSMKNQDIGFDIKTVKLRDMERWLRLFFLATIVFQFLGKLGRECREIPKIERRYSLSSKPKKGRNFIFSIYNIAMKIICDEELKVRYYRKVFSFKYRSADMQWVALC